MNRNSLILVLVLFYFFPVKANNEKTLITIYDKYCPHSQNLIGITYENKDVKNIISSKYEHKIFEKSSTEAKEFIKRYKINGFPYQIILNKKNTITEIKGNISLKLQIRLLKKPFETGQKINIHFKTQDSIQDKYRYVLFEGANIEYDERIQGIDFTKEFKNCKTYEEDKKIECKIDKTKRTYFFEKTNDGKLIIVSIDNNRETTEVILKNNKIISKSFCKNNFFDIGEKVSLIAALNCDTITDDVCEESKPVDIDFQLNKYSKEDVKNNFFKFMNYINSKDYQKINGGSYKTSYNISFIHSNSTSEKIWIELYEDYDNVINNRIENRKEFIRLNKNSNPNLKKPNILNILTYAGVGGFYKSINEVKYEVVTKNQFFKNVFVKRFLADCFEIDNYDLWKN